jgi:Sigma-70 region 2
MTGISLASTVTSPAAWDPDEADDLTAETFIEAFRRRAAFDPARGSVPASPAAAQVTEESGILEAEVAAKGAVAGLYPAMRAARLSPTAALRTV